jgi:hypothetical protein
MEHFQGIESYGFHVSFYYISKSEPATAPKRCRLPKDAEFAHVVKRLTGPRLDALLGN